MNSKACEAIELQLGKSLPLKCKFLIFYCTLGRLLVLTICEYKPDILPRFLSFGFFFVCVLRDISSVRFCETFLKKNLCDWFFSLDHS